ncbi:MAG: hypothetical protein L6Q98_04990 [Anaerolineae bacterium]|nr:hypothetical protein [Anaerolineae bacterium]NUQ05222.1 hypothetical protein [Anaerolineae bacterium]
MLKRWLIGAAFLVGACQFHTTDNYQTPSDGAADQQTAASDLHISGATISGTRIAVSLSSHWQVDEYNGLVIAENITTPDRMVMYLFVPPSDLLPADDEADKDNRAFSLLQRAILLPDRIGNGVTVSAPQHVSYEGCSMAYYLLAGSDGMNSLVLAVQVPGADLPVVLNASLPKQYASVMRERLVELLESVTINDLPLPQEILDHLPDPLLFPDHQADYAIVSSQR